MCYLICNDFYLYVAGKVNKNLPSKLTIIGLLLLDQELRTNTAFDWAAEVVVVVVGVEVVLVVVVLVVDVTAVVVVVSKQLKFSHGQPAAQLL